MAPIMLSIERTSEPAALQHAFEEFWYWGNWRGACQLLAILAQTATLEVVRRYGATPLALATN